ncbi:putative iron-regulated membrane protein [Stella humosa]|uniref:Putative iron-regulated membrane protein n=1 Tax=Stella humosa TaxID=94 RepID=A0A3N1MED1_9PROT|nr:PepSY-associated TM helix domain-containing protein [Stella humosa]ROQ01485.1 putative iron-regulated membrane protein [Stella humosa]BBK31863.1 membrane protein [Stella humosa]
MKAMARLRVAMAGLHIWGGLCFGWLLYAVFLTGTLSYFRDEISLWMRPELQTRLIEPAEAAERAVRRLEVIGQGAYRWLIEMPDARMPVANLAVWRDAGPGPRFQREAFDPAAQAPSPARATHGGDFLYYFHFDLNMPWRLGRFLVGLAAMAMLVAIVSGVIVHRRIFADFFTFRPGKGQRSWLDAHNAAGVLALPYHLMITYTGLVPLMFLYLPMGIDMAFPGQRAAFFVEAGQGMETPPAAGRPVAMVGIAPLVAEAGRRWGGEDVGRIDIRRPLDANARIGLTASDAGQLSHGRGRLLFDGTDGRLLASDADLSWVVATERALYGLHLGRFAEAGLRWLLFASGMAGTAMVATGLLLWAAARRRKSGDASPPFGHWLVETLNVATIAGLPIAIGAFFWANRLLPTNLAGRSGWEVDVFFAAWALAALYAVLRPRPAAWAEQLAAGAFLFAALPVLNALATDRGLYRSVAAGDWVFAGFDLMAGATALLLAALAWTSARGWPVRTRSRPAPARPRGSGA